MPLKKKPKQKTTTVREHLRKVPVSKKNPNGKTLVDKHLRHIDGKFLDKKLIDEIFLNYKKENIAYPSKKKLIFPDADKYDDLIAVWVDYFNNYFMLKEKMEPDMLKALMASESNFDPNAKNETALGITQITKSTLKILQNLGGEAKDFVFKDISQKDLKDPSISIAMAARWLVQKRKLAAALLKRPPTSDETIMVYKGILGDKSTKANNIMKKYREYYGRLKK